MIDNLIEKSDNIIICGGMAYTFLKTCFDMPIGKSLFDKKGAELAPGLLEKAKKKGCNIVLPCDWLCGQDFKNDQPTKLVTQEEGIPDDWEGMDCGPKSMAKFKEVVLASATVIWNGPAGKYCFIFLIHMIYLYEVLVISVLHLASMYISLFDSLCKPYTLT